MKGRKLVNFTTTLTWGGREYDAVAIIRPRVDQPHLSIDAGNIYWKARPPKVLSYTLFDYMGEDCTGDVFMKKDQEAIAAIILAHYRDRQFERVAERARGVI